MGVQNIPNVTKYNAIAFIQINKNRKKFILKIHFRGDRIFTKYLQLVVDKVF